MRKTAILIILTVIVAMPVAYASQLVEVLLVDKLDDERGYCIDMRGPKERANPANGLQAHTCYSYQGQLAIDQAFDGERIRSGEFRVVGFDVCMSIAAAEPGSALALLGCDGGPEQRFELTSEGRIESRGTPGLCLEVAGGDSRRGRGGTSSHRIRALTLQPCSGDRAAYQKWRLREKAD